MSMSVRECEGCEYLKYMQLEFDTCAKWYCTANCHHIDPCPIKNKDNIKSADDRRIEPLLKNLKDIGVIKSWYYNGTYHAE